MNLPTGDELRNSYCTEPHCSDADKRIPNPFYEELGCRRYNYAPSSDLSECRLVFLKDVLKNPDNKTLRRHGRFLWCRNLRYEGRDPQGFRQISFTVDKGQKRFTVSEHHMLCVPSKIYVNNNRYFRSKERTFFAFSTVFGYANTRRMLEKSYSQSARPFEDVIAQDSPYKPGTLVAPRLGYFYPQSPAGTQPSSFLREPHPYGIILAPSLVEDQIGKEFYRVRFGSTTYERVHPIQLEIINEV